MVRLGRRCPGPWQTRCCVNASNGPETEPEPARTGSQSIERALSVLGFFVEESSLSVTEISRRLGLSVSTAHRITRALVRAGYLDQDTVTERYRLGRMVAVLGRAATDSLNLADAQAVLDTAAAECGESVSLGVIDDRDVLILATAESSQPLRFDRATGSRTPVHASAIGKAILAFAPRDRWRGPSTTLPAFTERTIVAGVDLEGQLEQIRSDGVALNLEERYVGVCAVAAPVLDAAGVARAGVGFQVPLARFGADRQRELSERAVTLAAELAEALPLDRL